jgi:hypothetical protein
MVNALAHVLPRSVRLASGKGNRVLVNGAPLRMEWVGRGWLNDVRPILDALPERPDIVAARRMSPGARDALAKAGIGWVDETGAAEIAHGTIVISREGRAQTAEQSLSHWTPSVLGVAEALLCGTTATVAAMREATGLSTGSCANALRFLVTEGLLTTDAERGPHAARRIADAGRLLDAYAAAALAARTQPSVQVGVVWNDPVAGLARVGAKWDALGRRWACTGPAAASVLAPYLTAFATVDVYIETETVAGLTAAAEDAGLRPIEGGRLTLRPFPTAASQRLSVRKQRLWLASWPRVYVDLRASGVRGEEAAEHLREVLNAG